MSESKDTAEQQAPRVFLSYSRKDLSFVKQLAPALVEQGCTPDYDLIESDNVDSGISAEDQWWARLQDMIAAADIVVFIVSPDSAKSRVCDEEIAYTQALGKRLIPIICRKIDFSVAPPRLSALNVKIDFSTEPEGIPDRALQQLVKAIHLDVNWVRNSTRLIVAAKRWDAEGRLKDLLLNGSEVNDAEEIATNRPASAPPLPKLFLAYLRASREVELERRTISQVERARYLELVQVMRPFLEAELRIREAMPAPDHYGVAEEMRLEKEMIRSLLHLDTKWHPEPAIHRASTGAIDGYAEIFEFPCCKAIVKDFRSTGADDPPSQFRSDGCADIPEAVRHQYRPRSNPFQSVLIEQFNKMFEEDKTPKKPGQKSSKK